MPLPRHSQARVDEAILFRFHAGESVAALARDYDVTRRAVWASIERAASVRARTPKMKDAKP